MEFQTRDDSENKLMTSITSRWGDGTVGRMRKGENVNIYKFPASTIELGEGEVRREALGS